LKIRIEDKLPSGERISITIEGGKIDEQRVLQILEMLNLMTGKYNESSSSEPISASRPSQLKDVIWDAIMVHFGDGTWFTSKDLKDILKRYYGIDVKLNSLATYLLRFYQTGYLDRKGSRAGRIYRVRSSPSQSML